MTDTQETTAPQMPTREQIAKALYNHQPVGALVWSEVPEWVQSVYNEQADAVLALFPQPAPRVEPTVQVPVSLV